MSRLDWHDILIVKFGDLTQPLRLPLPAEARQAGLAGEELLHGGLLDGPLLGDQRLQRPEQPVHIRQRLGDGALLGLVRGNAMTETFLGSWY